MEAYRKHLEANPKPKPEPVKKGAKSDSKDKKETAAGAKRTHKEKVAAEKAAKGDKKAAAAAKKGAAKADKKAAAKPAAAKAKAATPKQSVKKESVVKPKSTAKASVAKAAVAEVPSSHISPVKVMATAVPEVADSMPMEDHQNGHHEEAVREPSPYKSQGVPQADDASEDAPENPEVVEDDENGVADVDNGAD